MSRGLVTRARGGEYRRVAGGLSCALALLVSLVLAACAPGRALEAWRLVGDLAAGPGPSRLKQITPAPERGEIAFRVRGRAYAADLYRPGAPAKAALVLVPGAAPEGRDDPRLVAFATSLARARFAVLVPELENLRALRVDPADAQGIADALRHLRRRGGRDAAAKLGLVAISYAAGPAVLAALKPDLRDEVGFLVVIGGYYKMEAVVRFFTTGYFRSGPEAPWQSLTPNARGTWAFLRANAQRLEDPGDRVRLRAMAERKLRDPEAEIGDLVAGLGPEGRRVHALLKNRDPDAVSDLIAALPEGIGQAMAGLDLARRDLSALQAEVILIHGRDDAVIPYSESLALSAALPADRVRLFLIEEFAHVEPGSGGLSDGLRLWRASYRLLELRDQRR